MAMRRPKLKVDQTTGSGTYVSVPDFYREKAVLVTGATGFLGQGLIEKLLRSCPDIGKIHIPIRSNKKGNTEQRYKQFLENKVFSELQKTKPNFGDKIIPFHGDITEDNIGMDQETYVAITKDVSVIFHCAADIRLNPSLRESAEVNIIGSKTVFELGKKCRNLCGRKIADNEEIACYLSTIFSKAFSLKAYIHVSTTFSNYILRHIEEKVYPPIISPDEAIKLIRHHDDEHFRDLEKEASDKSVYAGCKMVAESILTDNTQSEKSAVFRPCFISPALSEPYRGWCHGYGGYCGVLPHIITGSLPHLLGDPNTPIEILPVDAVINSLISVGWYIGTGRHVKKEPMVVNVNSSTDNPVTLKDLEQTVNTSCQDGRVKLTVISNRLYFFLVLFIQYLLPAFLLDILLILTGESPKYTKLFLRMRKVMKYLEKTTFRYPTYDFNNAKIIHRQLSDSDRKIFPFDVSSIRWKAFLHMWVEVLKSDSKK